MEPFLSELDVFWDGDLFRERISGAYEGPFMVGCVEDYGGPRVPGEGVVCVPGALQVG